MQLPVRPLALALFVGALAAAFWRAPTAAPPALAPPPASAAPALPATFVSERLPHPEGTASHPTLALLPDGRIAAAWLAGDGAPGRILFSVRERDGWRTAQTAASRESTAGGAFAYVSEIGQPMLYVEGSWLHLWYVSRTLGGSINHSLSTDGGKSWSKPGRLQTSPFANFGGEALAPPVPLADGGLGLPVGHRFLGQHGAWLRLAPTGQVLAKIRLPGTGSTTQPAVVGLDAQHALAISGGARLQVATSDDGGQSWQPGATIATVNPKINPNSPMAVLRLNSGRLLLAGNADDGRQTLQLWISTDQGKSWQASRRVESAPDGGAEFANPALLLGRDGRIHLAYDWRRQGIAHAAFSEAWLDGGTP